MKTCKKCGESKEATTEFFYASKTNKDRLSADCKVCWKEYYESNKDKIVKNGKQYRADNKSKILERKKQYRETNKEKISAYRKQYDSVNEEKLAECARRYRGCHKDNINIIAQRRRTRKLKLPATLTNEQWEIIKQKFGNKCAYCGKEKPLAQEHFLAISKGGEYTADNIIPACQSCNSSKGMRFFFDWYPKFAHYSKVREKTLLNYLGYKCGNQQLSLV